MDNKEDARNINVKDVRRFKEEDNEGHIKGSNKEDPESRSLEELRAAEDKSEYNRLDQRGKIDGNEQG